MNFNGIKNINQLLKTSGKPTPEQMKEIENLYETDPQAAADYYGDLASSEMGMLAEMEPEEREGYFMDKLERGDPERIPYLKKEILNSLLELEREDRTLKDMLTEHGFDDEGNPVTTELDPKEVLSNVLDWTSWRASVIREMLEELGVLQEGGN